MALSIDFNDPKYRLKERVKRLVQMHEKSRGITREIAEQIVRKVITEKEQPQC
jgi:hypothetical protein